MDSYRIFPFTQRRRTKIVKITHSEGLCAWGMCGVGAVNVLTAIGCECHPRPSNVYPLFCLPPDYRGKGDSGLVS